MQSTVDKNKSKHVNPNFSSALLARRLQNIITWRSDAGFLEIMDDSKLLMNSPLGHKDVFLQVAKDILAPNIGSLSIKTVHTSRVA